MPRSLALPKPAERLPTGVAAIDRLLGGGLEPDCLTEIYGEGGTGKTIFCLAIAARVALSERWVFYVDTEGVSLERLEASTGGRSKDVLRHLLLSSPKSLEEQHRAVETAARLARDDRRGVGLIVMDSATFFYRLSLSGSDEDSARQQLSIELATLLRLAIDRNIPVLFTNQVWRSVKDGTLEPLGGSFISHVAKTILRFDRLPGDRRKVTLVKHRSIPPGQAEFRITSGGIE